MSVVDAEGFSFCFLLLAALGGVVTLSASSLLSAAESGESGSLFLEALVRAGDSMASEAARFVGVVADVDLRAVIMPAIVSTFQISVVVKQ